MSLVVHAAELALVASLVAPAIAFALRTRRLPPALLHPGLAWTVFVAAHSAVHATPVLELVERSAAAHALVHAGLLALAVAFWLPVLHPASRLSGAGRALYLFLAAPALDLAGLYLIASGRQAAGIAMVVGMLPVGLAALGLTWRWIEREERDARAAEEAGEPRERQAVRA